MAFGYERTPRIFIGDSKPLTSVAYLNDNSTLIPQDNISSVSFTVVLPGDDPADPSIQDEPGTVIGDGTAIYVVDPSFNTAAGTYYVTAAYAYSEPNFGAITKRVVLDYDVADPFESTGSGPSDGAVKQAWQKFENLFDSENGGPWLRDMAIASRFDQSKLTSLIPEVLLAINQQMPFSNYNSTDFPYTENDGEALMAQGLLCSGIRDLMRAYTEQPNFNNSLVAFADRRDYLMRWTQVLTIEQTQFDKWLKQWKLRAYQLDHASLLVQSKAGRFLVGQQRSRNFFGGYG